MKKRGLKFIVTIIIIVTLAVGVWWWQWQAPYRTLIAFLHALERGDTDTLYALSLPRERELGLTKEIVERSYCQFLKPILLERYQLVRIRRISVMGLKPELWIRQYSVPFVLYFRGSDAKRYTVLAPTARYPGERHWRIPFSYFVFRVALTTNNNNRLKSFLLLHQLGFKVIVNDLGDIKDIRSAIEWEMLPYRLHYRYLKK